MKIKPNAPGGRNFGINSKRMNGYRILAFAFLAIPLVILLILPIKFISMPIVQSLVISAYEDGEYQKADSLTEKLFWFNSFEPYLAYLDQGTAQLAAGDYAAAEESLQNSLESWEAGKDLNQPPHAECKIRNNLAVAIAKGADSLDAAQKADELYRAQEILAPCASGGSSSDSNEDQETTDGNNRQMGEERQAAEQNSGQEPRENPQDPNSDQDPNSGNEEDGQGAPPEEQTSERESETGEDEGQVEQEPDPEAENRENELEQRNRETQDGSGSGEDGEGGSESEQTKPW